MVELVILVPHKVFVEPTEPVKHVSAETSEWNRINPTRFARAQAKVTIADAKKVRQRGGDRPGSSALVRRHRHTGATNIVSARSQQPSDQTGDVIGRILDVGVHAQDQLTRGLRDSEVDRGRDGALGIRDQSDRRVSPCVLLDDGPRPVLAHPVDH